MCGMGLNYGVGLKAYALSSQKVLPLNSLVLDQGHDACFIQKLTRIL